MHRYNAYTRNTRDEAHDGTAMLIKHNIKHIIDDFFITNLLQVTVTRLGNISIATTYLPPKRPLFTIL